MFSEIDSLTENCMMQPRCSQCRVCPDKKWTSK